MVEIGLIDFKGDGCVIMFPLANVYKKGKRGLTEFWVYAKHKTWLKDYPQIPLVLFDEWWG